MSYRTVLRGYFCAQGVFRLFFRKLSFQACIFLPFRFFPQSIFPLIHNPLLPSLHFRVWDLFSIVDDPHINSIPKHS